jgi:hypothetical protein
MGRDDELIGGELFAREVSVGIFDSAFDHVAQIVDCPPGRVRREDCLLKGEQGIFPYWFYCKRVDRSCSKMSVSERPMQRDLVDKTAARTIDEHGAEFHFRKDARRNDTGCFVSQWKMKRHNI